jgi:hypothetical protein
MKTQLAITTHYDSTLEEIISKKDAALKERARKNALHFALDNKPEPTGHKLQAFTSDIKSGYEQLATEIFQHLQPDANLPEAKMDADALREKDKELDAEIKEKENQNRIDEYELDGYNPGTVPSRIMWAIICTAIIGVGEVLFNTKAFQVAGETMLFALLLSISVSFAVFILAHMAPFLFKRAKTSFRRRLVVAGALFITIGLFQTLAIFRSRYLANHQVDIEPFYFVIINLFFFIVSALLSYFILPSSDEIKQHDVKLKIYKAIQKRKKEIKQLNNEKENIKMIVLENTKARMRILYYTNYALDRIKKMYLEALGIFMNTNILNRKDGKVPDCFSEAAPSPDIEKFSFSFIPSKNKVEQ